MCKIHMGAHFYSDIMYVHAPVVFSFRHVLFVSVNIDGRH